MKTNRITLKQDLIEISASFPCEETLDDVLPILEGMLKALGYCFNGHLEIVEEE